MDHNLIMMRGVIILNSIVITAFGNLAVEHKMSAYLLVAYLISFNEAQKAME